MTGIKPTIFSKTSYGLRALLFRCDFLYHCFQCYVIKNYYNHYQYHIYLTYIVFVTLRVLRRIRMSIPLVKLC